MKAQIKSSGFSPVQYHPSKRTTAAVTRLKAKLTVDGVEVGTYTGPARSPSGEEITATDIALLLLNLTDAKHLKVNEVRMGKCGFELLFYTTDPNLLHSRLELFVKAVRLSVVAFV